MQPLFVVYFSLSMSAYLALTACTSLAPDYVTPQTPQPAQFSGYSNWETISRINAPNTDNWWQIFNDPLINSLNERLIINNQNLKASEAQYRAALAAVVGAQAATLPSINAAFSVNQGKLTNPTSLSTSTLPTTTTHNLSSNVNWELDLWGRIRSNIDSNQAKAQASLADLHAARLSTHALLTQSYLHLRHHDTHIALLADIERGYQRFLTLTHNRIKAGIASNLDATQAQTQLYTIQAQQLVLKEQRQRYQNAIATLVGVSAGDFSIASHTDSPALVIPEAPALIPSQMLIHRPDIIASERRVYAANQQIGIAQSAYFPTINLIASASYRNRELANLIDLPNTLWSLGPSLAQTLFDGGLRDANKAIAIANMEQAAANYKQTVLTAFQEVEDNLATQVLLAQEARIQQQAVSAASQALTISQRQYRAGITSALTVISAQTSELSAKRSLIDSHHRQRLAAVQLWKNTANGAYAHERPSKAP